MIIAIDTETYEYDEKEGVYKPVLNARKFTLGCAKTDCGKKEFFTNHKEMRKWLYETIEKNKERKKRTFIYAHNMEYDWYAIMKDDLLNKDNKYIVFHPFISIYKEKGYFLDSMAFFRMSLAKVAEIIGMEKMELPANPKTIEEIKPYLENDVDIVLQGILHLKKSINELGFRPRKLLTAGQLAITSFMTYCRRKGTDFFFTEYNREKKIFQIVKSKHPTLVREAFRGGNNTAFLIGEHGEGTLIDVNSLYPFGMTEMEFPNLRSEKLFENPSKEQLDEWLDKYIGICRCTIKAPVMENPYLPIRYAGYTTFPSDKTLRGTWTFLEIKRALSLGYEIEEIEHVITWIKSPVNPLRGFIEEIHKQKRDATTDGKKKVIKLLMNNLYGKFSQYKRNKDYKLITRSQIQEFLEQGYEISNKIEDKYILVKENDDYDPSYTNPIISAYITAWSRDYLWMNLQKINAEDRLYCDTDSILIKNFSKYVHLFDFRNKFENKELHKEFSIEEWNEEYKELGDWKIEKQGEVKILGEKRYYVGDDVKISGTAKRIIEEEIEIEKDGTVRIIKKGKKIIDDEETIHTRKMVGFREGLATGNIEGIGSFRDDKIEMRPHCKRMLFMPEKIDEVKLFTNTET